MQVELISVTLLIVWLSQLTRTYDYASGVIIAFATGTQMLLELGLTPFNTLRLNNQTNFARMWCK